MKMITVMKMMMMRMMMMMAMQPLGRRPPWKAIHTRQALSHTDHAGPTPEFVFVFVFVFIFVFVFEFVSIFVSHYQGWFNAYGLHDKNLFVTQREAFSTNIKYIGPNLGIINLILVVVARIAAPHKLSDVEANGGCAGG